MTWEQAKNAMIREFGFECEATIALFRDAEQFGELRELSPTFIKTRYEMRKLQAEIDMLIEQTTI